MGYQYHLLVIDDEKEVRNIYRNFFSKSKRGFQVDVAENGKIGLNKLMNHDYDVALIDLRMPELDGMEVIREIRQAKRRTKLVVRTGYGERDELKDAILEHRVDYWFDKGEYDITEVFKKTKELAESAVSTVVFVTALDVECKAVIKAIGESEPVPCGGTVYRIGEYVTPNKLRWRVVVAEVGKGQENAGIETEKMLSFFRPTYAFFIGVAGGRKGKGVQLGDVIAADTVRGYERGKEEDEGFKPTGDIEHSSSWLLDWAKTIPKDDHWFGVKKGKIPAVFVGPIASGNRVIKSTRTPVYQLIDQQHSDVVAVEMEGIGFLKAVRKQHSTSGIVIRGISDLIENKSEENDKIWQPIAAENATTFAFAILDKLREY